MSKNLVLLAADKTKKTQLETRRMVMGWTRRSGLHISFFPPPLCCNHREFSGGICAL